MELYDRKTAADRTGADEIVKKLIVHAGSNVTPATPLNKTIPTVADINLEWESDRFTAFADPKRIDDAYTSYWDWFEFRKNIVVANGPAYTESVIAHELDHASYAKTVYDQWKAGGSTGGSWDDYWVAHVKGLEEPAYKPDKAGGPVSGELPDTIAPSPIEFQAYVKQFVEYFHRVEFLKQEFLADGVILFYPLQTSLAGGPVASSIKKDVLKVVFYEPVKYGADPGQKEVVRTLFRYAMQKALKKRPEADRAAMTTEFGSIITRVDSGDIVDQAKRDYQPKR
jgi:hypothetical protein